jgi:hypothetical protein
MDLAAERGQALLLSGKERYFVPPGVLVGRGTNDMGIDRSVLRHERFI